jgi:hypothetical protein
MRVALLLCLLAIGCGQSDYEKELRLTRAKLETGLTRAEFLDRVAHIKATVEQPDYAFTNFICAANDLDRYWRDPNEYRLYEKSDRMTEDNYGIHFEPEIINGELMFRPDYARQLLMRKTLATLDGMIGK